MKEQTLEYISNIDNLRYINEIEFLSTIKTIPIRSDELYFDWFGPDNLSPTQIDIDFINNILRDDPYYINTLKDMYECIIFGNDLELDGRDRLNDWIPEELDDFNNFSFNSELQEYTTGVKKIMNTCFELYNYPETIAMWRDLGSNIYDYVSPCSSDIINNTFSRYIDTEQLLIFDKDIFFGNNYQYNEWNNPFAIEQAAKVDYIYFDSCKYSLQEAPYQLSVYTRQNNMYMDNLLKSSLVHYPEFMWSMWDSMNNVHESIVVYDPLDLEHIRRTGTYAKLIDEGVVKPEQMEFKRRDTQRSELRRMYQQGCNDVDMYWRDFYIKSTGLVRTSSKIIDSNSDIQNWWFLRADKSFLDTVAFPRIVDGVPDNTAATIRYRYAGRIPEDELPYRVDFISKSSVSGFIRANLILFGPKYIVHDPIAYYSYSWDISWLDWIFYNTLWVWRLYDYIVNFIISFRSEYVIDTVEVGLSDSMTYSDRYTYLLNKRFEELPNQNNIDYTLYWSSISIIGISLILIFIEPFFFALINFSRYWMLITNSYLKFYKILYKPRIRKKLKAIVRYIKRTKSLSPKRRGITWNKRSSWSSNYRRNKWIYIRSFELGKWYYWIRKRVFHKQELRAFVSTALYEEYADRIEEYLRFMDSRLSSKINPLSRIRVRKRRMILMSYRNTFLRRFRSRRYITWKYWGFIKANYGRYSFIAVYELILLTMRAFIFVIRAIFKITWYIICYLFFTEIFITGAFIIGIYLWRFFVLQLSFKIKESFHKSVWRFLIRVKNLYITINYYPYIFFLSKGFFEKFLPYEIFYHGPRIYVNWVRREHDYLFTKFMKEWLPLPHPINRYEWRNLFINNIIVTYISIFVKTIFYGLFKILYSVLNDILSDALKNVFTGDCIVRVYVLYLKIRLFLNKILIALLLIESRIMKYFGYLLIFSIFISMFKFLQSFLIAFILVPSIWLGLFKLLLVFNNILVNGLFKNIGFYSILILSKIVNLILILSNILLWFLKRLKIVFIFIFLYYMGYFNPVLIINIYYFIYFEGILEITLNWFDFLLHDVDTNHRHTLLGLSWYDDDELYFRQDNWAQAFKIAELDREAAMRYRFYHYIQVWLYDWLDWNRYYDKYWKTLWYFDSNEALAARLKDCRDRWDDRIGFVAQYDPEEEVGENSFTKKVISGVNSIKYASPEEAERILKWIKIHGRKHVPIFIEIDKFPYYTIRPKHMEMFIETYADWILSHVREKFWEVTHYLPYLLRGWFMGILWHHIWLDIECRPYWTVLRAYYPEGWWFYYPILIRVSQIFLFLMYGKLISDLILFYYIPEYLYFVLKPFSILLYERSYTVLYMNNFYYLFYYRDILHIWQIFWQIFWPVLWPVKWFILSLILLVKKKVLIPYYNFVWRDWFMPLTNSIYCFYDEFDYLDNGHKFMKTLDDLHHLGIAGHYTVINWVYRSIWYSPNLWDDEHMYPKVKITLSLYILFKKLLDMFLSILRISPDVLESRLFRDRDFVRMWEDSSISIFRARPSSKHARHMNSFMNIFLNGHGWSPVLDLLDVPDQMTVSKIKSSIHQSILADPAIRLGLNEYANPSALLKFIRVLKYSELTLDKENSDILAIYPDYIDVLRAFDASFGSIGSKSLRSPNYLDTPEVLEALQKLSTHINPSSSKFFTEIPKSLYSHFKQPQYRKFDSFFDYYHDFDYLNHVCHSEYDGPREFIDTFNAISYMLDGDEVFNSSTGFKSINKNLGMGQNEINKPDFLRYFIPTLQVSGSNGGLAETSPVIRDANFSHWDSESQKYLPNLFSSCYIKQRNPDYVLGGYGFDGIIDDPRKYDISNTYFRESKLDLIPNYIEMIISYSLFMFLSNKDWTYFLRYNNEYLWTLFRNYYQYEKEDQKYDFYDPSTEEWFVDYNIRDELRESTEEYNSNKEYKKILDIEYELNLIRTYRSDQLGQNQSDILKLDGKDGLEHKQSNPLELDEKDRLEQKQLNLLLDQIPSTIGKIWFSLYTKFVRTQKDYITSEIIKAAKRSWDVSIGKSHRPKPFELSKAYLDSSKEAYRSFKSTYDDLVPIMDQVIIYALIKRFEIDNGFSYNPHVDFDAKRFITDPAFHSYYETLSYARDLLSLYTKRHENCNPFFKAIEYKTIYSRGVTLNSFFGKMSNISESDYAYIQKFYEFFEDIDSLLFNNEGPDCFFYKSVERFFLTTDYGSGDQRDQYLIRYCPSLMRNEENLFIFLFLIHQLFLYTCINGWFAGNLLHPPMGEMDFWYDTILVNNFKSIHNFYHTGVGQINRSYLRDTLSAPNSGYNYNPIYGWDLDWIDKLNPLYDYNLIFRNCNQPRDLNFFLPYFSNLYYLLDTKLFVYGSHDRFLWRWINISSLIVCLLYLYTCGIMRSHLVFMEYFTKKHKVFLDLILKTQNVINLKYSVIGFNHHWTNWFKGRDLIDSMNWLDIVRKNYVYWRKK